MVPVVRWVALVLIVVISIEPSEKYSYVVFEADEITAAFKSQGINIKTNTNVKTSVEKHFDNFS
jgi:preprotein translocase subunit SecY